MKNEAILRNSCLPRSGIFHANDSQCASHQLLFDIQKCLNVSSVTLQNV